MMGGHSGTMARPAAFPESASRPVVSPLSPSVAYASDAPDDLDDLYGNRAQGYTYSREGHPNADIVAVRLNDMEGCGHGTVLGSGMAAVTCALAGLLRAGDHAVGGSQLYGRSRRLLTDELPRLGIQTTLADSADIQSVRSAVRPQTRLILVEVVSNPTLRVADISAISELCSERGILLAVDNTFATPRAFRPFEHGADIVIHSLTKLLSGHSDAMLGWVGARDSSIFGQLHTFSVTAGLTPSPFDCWLAERGLLSFDLRFDRAQASAAYLAEHLATLPGVSRAIYPGRTDHPDHPRAAGLLGNNGCNMVSFEVAGGRPAANAFARAAKGVSFAPTLGDVGTTLSHPASSSHRAMPAEEREKLGISEGFFRVSVGLEDPRELAKVFSRAAEGIES